MEFFGCQLIYNCLSSIEVCFLFDIYVVGQNKKYLLPPLAEARLILESWPQQSTSN